MPRIRLIIAILALELVFTNFTHGQSEQVYFGSLHSHTSYSDGSGTPAEAYTRARDVAHLDFMAITEHNHAIQIKPKDRAGYPIGKDHTLYNGTRSDSLIQTAKRFTRDGKFIALYGQEFSTISSGNHANVFDVDEVITTPNGRFDLLVNDWLTTHLDSFQKPAVVQFNHPSNKVRSTTEYGRDDFASTQDWIATMSKHAHLIEVLNGPGLSKSDGQRPEVFASHYTYYLNLGFHLGPTGDQDNHYKTWGTLTTARTGIIADSLTKTSLLEAMRSRHVYATEAKGLRFVTHISYAGMPADKSYFLCGDIVPPPPEGTDLTITYSLKDDGHPETDHQIDVMSDTIGGVDEATVIVQQSQHGDTPVGHPGSITGVKYTGGRQYVFFRIHQTDEDGQDARLWTAPIWFETGTATTSAGEPVTDESRYVASRRSKVYHTDPECQDAQHISSENRVIGHEATVGRELHQGCPR